MKPKNTSNEPTGMKLNDLLDLIRELPVVPNINNRENVLRAYKSGGWESVMRFERFIRILHKSQQPRQTIKDKVIHGAFKTLSRLIGLKNKLFK